MYEQPLYTGYACGAPLPLPPLTMAEAWKKYARGDQDALRYHLERMDDLREALSCMRWNRQRRKWATKHQENRR